MTEEKEPLAPSKEQIKEVWEALDLGGKPNFQRLSLTIADVENDIKQYQTLPDWEDETLDQMNKFMAQLVKLMEGMIANKNMTFMEGHFHAIENYKKTYGEDSPLPVRYNQNGILEWVNRSARRG